MPPLLLLPPTAPKMLPALCSPQQGRSLQSVPDPFLCSQLPVDTHPAASKSQDRHSHGAEGDRKTHSKSSLGLTGPQKGCGCFMNCERSYQGRGALVGDQSAALPQIEDPLTANVSVLYSLCIYYTNSTHLGL